MAVERARAGNAKRRPPRRTATAFVRTKVLRLVN
jgi:hypothetical protein